MTKREAAHSSAALWAAARHEPVYILEKGSPRFRIEAIDHLDPLDELERRGLLVRAQADPPPIPDQPAGRRYSDEEFDDLLAEMRADR